jgi:hypothetical protein
MARMHWELERQGLKPEPFRDLDAALARARALAEAGHGPVRLVEVMRHKRGQWRSLVRVIKR